LPTSNKSPYDIIIVGAGINGCTSAYFLHQAGLRVALVDKEGIARGGSGAAGAFISPKISKEGELKEVMRDAHLQSLTFYATYFPQHTLLKPLLHIAKDELDDKTIEEFRVVTKLATRTPEESINDVLSEEAKIRKSLYFDEGAVVDAVGVCHALAEGIDFYVFDVNDMQYENEMWTIGHLRGKHVVLAIGAYPKLVDMPYLTLRGIWGHRIDIETSTDVPCILHHLVSISPTNNGTIAIGATHNVHFSPFGEQKYDIEAGRVELLQKASKTLKLNNIKIIKDYTGLRSGSNDYMPLLGGLVDASSTIALYPHLQHGQVVDSSQYCYYPSVTMINGSGGYGFVLAPYLAQKLKEYLVDATPIPPTLQPSRFFTRWVKSQKRSKCT
jgi:tRNA 5-methylaminomethyl-2-thiouridine biosynthesis bifunctional protein